MGAAASIGSGMDDPNLDEHQKAELFTALKAKYDIESRRSSVDEATLLESLKQEYLLKARELTANTDSVQLNGGVSDEEAARQALAFAAQLEQQQGGHSPSSSANGTAAMQTEPGQASDAAAAAAAAALSPPASTKTSDFRKRRLSVTAKRAAPKAVAPEGRRPSTLYRAQEIGAAPVAPLPFAETVIGTYSCHGVEPSYYEEEGFTAKINQDRGCVVFPFGDHPRQAVFAVFDGHGEHGDIISHFVMNELQSRLEKHPALQSDPGKAFKEVYVAVDRALSKSQAAESTFSGTTAVSILMREGHLWVANAGDSRAVVAQRRGVGSGPGAFVAKDLSIDQNPNSPLEQKRIEASGGFVSPPPEPGLSVHLEACIGFSGGVLGGLKVTPCGNYTVYPLGKILIVRSLVGGKTAFLEGHTNDVCCVAMSPDGRKLATGQMNHAGVKADVCVWDLNQAIKNCDSNEPHGGGALIKRLRQHLGKVQGLDFSCDGRYLATLGGQDDNTVVVWDVEAGKAVCGAPAAQDSSLAIKWLNCRNDRLVTAGNYNLRVWQIDVSIPKIHAVDAKMGTIRRIIQCLSIAPDDSHAIAGTRTGDLLRFKIDRDGIQSCNEPDAVRPTLSEYSRDKFGKGVKAVCCVRNPVTGAVNCLVGGGDGSVSFVNPALNKVRDQSAQLMGGCTSLALCPDGKGFFAGTELSNRYWVSMNMETELRGTCHYGRVNDVVFPANCPSLFVTCSVHDIRIWNVKQRQELLRIQVPNLECSCIGISGSGSTIVSGWSDGKIRAFYPESGKLKFVIADAHADGVTALALAHDDDSRPPWRIISGGGDGRVRVWRVTPSHQAMAISWKEHRGAVTCVKVSTTNEQCVTSSEDGSCIVWDLDRGVRLLAMFEPTVFKSIVYHPDESQYLTCGSNHKITYWDAYDGSAIREIDGGEEEMNALDVDRTGACFVSGGDDALVKVWHYDDGIATAVGRGHSGKVGSVRISPDCNTIVSVGAEGGIFIWSMPTAGEGPVHS